MRLPKKFSQKSRKVFFFIHLWTGLLIGLWFVMMGLTGSLLSWKSEIGEWEARRTVSAPLPKAGEKIIPASKAVAALQAAYPDLNVGRGLNLPNAHGGYYSVINRVRGKGDERTTHIYLINPVTAQVYPPVEREKLWIDITEKFHWSLLLGVKGVQTNGFLTFFTIFMLISGIWLWWPSNLKQFKQRITWKRGVNLRRSLYDLHNMMGVYMFPLLMLIAFTGLVICYNGQTDQSIRKGINNLAGVKEEPRGGRGGGEGRGQGRGREGAIVRGERGGRGDAADSGNQLSIDQMVVKAQEALPNNTLTSIRLPRRPSQPFQATYDRFELGSAGVSFDSTTGQRLNSDGSPANPGDTTMNTMFQLHYGWFGGNWSKILYCISGFFPLGLFITGLWMWLKKKKFQRDRKKPATPKVQPTKTDEKTQMEERVAA
jgi:uncharacterized iron-regulated membrane protein